MNIADTLAMASRIPITKDNCSFEDRQKKIWEDMEKDMERRRREPLSSWAQPGREWEEEIDKMRKEFFHLSPENPELGTFQLSGTLSRLPARDYGRILETDDGKSFIEKNEKGQPIFKVRFNMKDYKPEEVNVKMDSTKIMVSARHEEKGEGSSVSREYNREVHIPRDIDPLSLQCSLSPDGYLVVQAPLPVPNYSVVKDSGSVSHSPPSVVKSSSSHQTSSSGSNKPLSAYASSSDPDFSQQQQQVHAHTVSKQHAQSNGSNKPPAAFIQSTYNYDETLSHPDHVVPSYKPPVDLSKLDMVDRAPPRSTSQPFHSASSSHLQSSAFSKLPPFSTISSTFPSGHIFSESSKQAQLSTPTVTSHDGKFQLTMPIDDYRPEELTVKTQDRKVVICAKREVTSGSRAQFMEMNREHSIPDNVDPFTVKAFFTDTNNLIIEAPFIKS